ETIEGMRAFEVIKSEVGKVAYEDIVDNSFTVQQGGVDYTVDVVVDDYYFLADRVSVSKTPPSGVTASSFKQAELTVAWNTGVEFQVDQNTSTSGRLGSGSITVASIIPSIPSLNNAKVAAEDDGALGYPPVDYTPGLNPDIVAFSLGDQKFKESTTPAPIVRRNDQLVETWFDVITYTSNGTDATFLRREEFASISCACTLRASAGDDGREPTTWNGAEYDEGALVEKQFGESASNKQSQYCDVCCQDHHDTASGLDSYRPLASSFTGDHPHYDRDNKGVLTEAGVGDDYIEACRLVRKDGFFRVAQDFMLQSQTAFPENFLNDGDEVDDYSDYVTTAIEDHFAGDPWPAHGLEFDGRDALNRSALPTATGATSQQLRSRGIYTDVVSTALQNNLDNCFDNSDPPVATPENPDCNVENISTPLEIYPFFDVQLTLLSRWTGPPLDDPVKVTNEELETDNTHSRGLASLFNSMEGLATANSNIETGNVGLISIAEIAEVPPPEYSDSDLFLDASGGTTPPPPGSAQVSGTLTAGTDTTTLVPSVEGGDGATCTRPDNDTFICVIDYTATAPTLTVGNYYTTDKTLIACSPGLTILSYSQGIDMSTTWTQFALPTIDTSGIEIIITLGSSCP
ncbi:MAG TPA: hypothetical protein VI566_08315, partial [Xanthomonadales bacterium]|nr:hypothetical protein [Xanthomonadales bacterium]